MIKPILTYYDIAEGVKAFSSTRMGGVSKDSFGEFNINGFCGDDELSVSENKKALAEELCVDVDKIIIPHQIHRIECRTIAPEFFGMPDNIRKMLLEGVDCVLTDIRNLCIGVSTADCIPILLYDNEHHAIAAVHAGWRGTQQRIVEKTIAEMDRQLGVSATNLVAAIGPSIGVDAFEVGPEVYESFQSAGFGMESISKKISGKWHIDLWQANMQSLERVGVAKENIQLSGICTYTHSDDFFSARKLTIHSGRILSGIIQR